MRRVLLQVPPNRRPVLAPMHAPHPARRMCQPPVLNPRMVGLECRVRVAEHDLAHVAQAVLDVVREAGPVRHEADAHDVQAVQLVHHRDEEGAVRGAEVGEAVRGRELRAPIVVRAQPEVRLAGP